MSEPHTKKLGDVVELVIDNRGRNPKSYEERGIPVIDNFLITSEGKARLSEVKRFINDETYDSFLRKYIQEGDVLMTLVGNGYGKVATTPKEKCAIIQNTIGLRCNDQNDNQYLYYLLKSSRDALMNLNRGAAQPSIKVGDVLDLEFQFPSLKEQQRVAGILKGIDDKIELNTQTNQTLEQIAQAIFKSWFVDFEPVKAKMAVLNSLSPRERVGVRAKEQAELAAMSVISAKDEAALKQLQAEQPDTYTELAQTAALFPAAMVDSELGEIPEGWEVSTIGESYDVVMGQSPKGDTYNENKKGTLFYQGRAEFGWRFPSPRLYTTDPKRMAPQGDVLMSVRAPVGDLNIALEDCCIGRGLSALRHNSGSTSFTYYQLKDLQKKFDTFNGEGTVFGSINQKDLKGIKTVNPSVPLVKLFIDKITVFDQEIGNRSNEIISLNSIRDTLLPKLLSGELTLPNTEEA